jgi:hypothetical protein
MVTNSRWAVDTFTPHSSAHLLITFVNYILICKINKIKKKRLPLSSGACRTQNSLADHYIPTFGVTA